MTKLLNSVLTGPGLIRYGIKKHKEMRAEEKTKKKEHEKNQALARKGQKMAFAKEKQAAPVFKQGLRQLQRQLEGQHKLPSDLGDIISRYQKAGEGAKEVFEPIQKAALANYTKDVVPGINTEYGSNSKSSSALNQALAASKQGLEMNLASGFAEMQNQLAQNLLGQSQNAKMFNQQNRGSLINQAIGQPSAYTPPQISAAPQSMWERFGPAATSGLGAVVGGVASGGNPQAIASGSQLGSGIGNSLFGR